MYAYIAHDMHMQNAWKKNPKSFCMFIVFVVHQGCLSHILFSSSIEQPNALETPVDIGRNTNKISP